MPFPMSPSPSGAPPQAGPPQGFSGPASAPSANPGLEADALVKVRVAASILEQALPNIPFGSEAHKAVLSALTGLSKIAPAAQMPNGVQTSMLQGLQQDVQKSAMLQQLQKFAARRQQAGMAPQAGGPAGAGGSPPSVPPMAMQGI